MAVLLGLNLVLISGSGLIAWLVMPLQALGIFWVLVSGLEAWGSRVVRESETDPNQVTLNFLRMRMARGRGRDVASKDRVMN
jgi:hypothetical protein